MERLPRQSAWWRGYALLVAIGVLSAATTGPQFADVGVNRSTAKDIYFLTALVGLGGYAFGFRLLSVTFWRIFAVIFTADMAVRWTIVAARPLLADAAGLETGNRHDAVMALFVFALIALVCLALLRHADLVSSPIRGTDKDHPLLKRLVAKLPLSSVSRWSRNGLVVIGRVVSVTLLAAAPGICILAMLLNIGSDRPLVSLLTSTVLMLPFVVAGLILAAPAVLLARFFHRASVVADLAIGLMVGIAIGIFMGGALPADEDVRAVAVFNPRGALLGCMVGAAYGLWAAAMWCLIFRRKAIRAGPRNRESR